MRIANARFAWALGLGLTWIVPAGPAWAEIDRPGVAGRPSSDAAAESGPVAQAGSAETGDSRSGVLPAGRKAASGAVVYPFPGRRDLFLSPTKKPPPRTIHAEKDSTVVLLGLANVDGPRAVLRIHGIVTALGPGESWGTVRVLRIDPPQVVLQDGGRRWTEELVAGPPAAKAD